MTTVLTHGGHSLSHSIKARPVAAGRVAVLVLGMHRSGTSALARVLSLLGCALPRRLMEANPTQEAGHWESEAVRALNDEILETVGSQWCDWLPVSAGWYQSPLYAGHVARGREVLREEFGAAGLFVLKDPRICRMVPFWLDVFAAEDIRPAMVMPLRNPLEVADSLQKRDGIDPSVGMLLWLRHVLDAEQATRGQRRVICSYEALLDNWAGVVARIAEGVGLPWARNPMVVEREVEQFLCDALRHNRHRAEAVEANPLLSVWIRQTYAILSRWDVAGEDAGDYPALDRIRAAFDEAGLAFARPLLIGREDRQRAQDLAQQLARDRHYLEGRIAELQYDLAQAGAAQGALEALREEAARADASDLRLAEALEAAQSEAKRAADKLREAEGWVFRLAGERQAGELSLRRAEIRLEQSEKARQSAELQMTRVRAELAMAQAALRARVGSEAPDADAMRDMAAQLVDMRRQLRAVEALRADDGARLHHLHDEAATLTTLLREAQQQLAQWEERARDAEHQAEAADKARMDLEQKLAERFGEIAAMTTVLSGQEADTQSGAAQAAWLREVSAVVVQRPGWWSIMPAAWQHRRELRLLKQRGLFDAGAYRARYADVAESGIEPLRHFILHGLAEGRHGGA